MALGLGFNKAKILQTAEKYVAQGKIANAITEYRKILKKDPRDLMTLNTVGDLHVRAGNNEDAVQCFYELAEKSVEAGFVPRAIAVYKRITKMDQEAMPALTKLGELYSMQGLLRDARAHYLQAVEIYMRRRDLNKAREVFEKILMLDMENPRLQRRMAELYAETGKTAEAVATYLSAAERFLNNNEAAEAGTTLKALLKLAPDNPEANVLRGRVYFSEGDTQKTIATLQSIPALGGNKEALNALFHAYRKQSDLEHAAEVAQKLFDDHEDFAGLALVADDLVGKGAAEQAFAIYQKSAQRLLGQNAFGGLIEGLQKVLKADSSNIAVLELLWNAYRLSGNVSEGRETASQLARAYVTSDQMEQAREVYAELVALEPDDPEHRRLLRQVEARLTGTEVAEPAPAAQEATPLMAMEFATAPEEEATRVETLPPREQALVKNCLTESELYLTYHQMPRAIETLEIGLLEVPGNLTLHEHLMPLYEQSQLFQKAADCAQVLTEAYSKVGDGERAARYGELVVAYQQRAKESGAAQVAEETPAAATKEEPAPPPPAESPVGESQVREIDLSMEWASLSESAPASPVATADGLVEEAEFYLQAGLASEAAAAVERLRGQFPTHQSLADFEARLEALQPRTASPAQAPSAPPLMDQPVEAAVQEVSAFPEALAAMSEPEAAAVPAPFAEETPEPVLDQLARAAEPPPAPRFESAPESTAPARISPERQPPMPAAVSPLDSLAGELNLEAQTAGAFSLDAPASPAPAGLSPGFLDDVFAEFKEDVGETATADDLETHYNMGVAFKEMALYDEAIGEFQKVHQIAESVKDYSRVVPCCSLLATCFLEKGMPQLAVKWYQTALGAPGVDAETSLAILYEMGSAYELAGDRAAALKSFMDVYARNIDYRNVAERIRDLQQSPS